MRIRRLSVHQTSLTLGLIYLILSLFLLPLYIWAAMRNPLRPLPSANEVLLFPVIYAAAAYGLTALICLIYNWVSHLTGGIGLVIEEEPLASPEPEKTP